jgi:translation initiation factor IF-2
VLPSYAAAEQERKAKPSKAVPDRSQRRGRRSGRSQKNALRPKLKCAKKPLLRHPSACRRRIARAVDLGDRRRKAEAEAAAIRSMMSAPNGC